MQIAECYKILNVSPGEEWLRVRKSYHSLARKFHPDINREKADTQWGDTLLKEINQAFEKLETYYRANIGHQEFHYPRPEKSEWGALFKVLGENPVGSSGSSFRA